MTAMVLLSSWMASQVEFWMPVQGFPAYDVSNLGRVRSYWIKRHRKGVIGDTPKIMRPQISVKHAGIALSKNGEVTRQYVHRLVANAFIPNPLNLPEVNHITGYPADNRQDGLEWTTHKQNHEHAAAVGLHARGSERVGAKLTEAIVVEIRQMLHRGEKQADIAARFRVGQATVSGVKSGRCWSHVT